MINQKRLPALTWNFFSFEDDASTHLLDELELPENGYHRYTLKMDLSYFPSDMVKRDLRQCRIPALSSTAVV